MAVKLDTTALENAGMTNAQIKIYLALLELGETSSGPLIKQSGLQNSVVYNNLNQLIEQGLVTFVVKGKTKYFSAADPENLIRSIDEKKENLQNLVPQLKMLQNISNTKQEARVFLGWKGVYNAFNSILDTLPQGADYTGFAAGFEEDYSDETKLFFKEFQKKRDAMKYKVKLIANESARTQVNEYDYYSRFSKPEYKFVDGFAPVGSIIFADNVMNVSFQDEPIAVITTSRHIAQSHRKFFDAMWKMGKK